MVHISQLPCNLVCVFIGCLTTHQQLRSVGPTLGEDAVLTSYPWCTCLCICACGAWLQRWNEMSCTKFCQLLLTWSHHLNVFTRNSFVARNVQIVISYLHGWFLSGLLKSSSSFGLFMLCSYTSDELIASLVCLITYRPIVIYTRIYPVGIRDRSPHTAMLGLRGREGKRSSFTLPLILKPRWGSWFKI